MGKRVTRGEKAMVSEVSTASAPVNDPCESNSDSDSNFSDCVELQSDGDEFDPANNLDECDEDDEGSERQRNAQGGSVQPSSLPPSNKKRSYRYVTRNRRIDEPAEMRKRWKTGLNEMFNDIRGVSCCKKLQCFQHCNVDYLKAKMENFRNMNYEQRRLSLMEMKGSNGRFYFDGHTICNMFLKTAFRFSPDLISQVRNGAVRARITDSFGSDMRSQTTSNSDRGPTQRDAVIMFLERMAETCGDRMPDNEEVHLPYFRKRDAFSYFTEEFKILHSADVKCPSKSYFYSTWKKDCRNIKVRKLGRFAKCSTCEQLRSSIHDAASRRDYKSLALYRRAKAEHNELIAKERREYKKKRDRAMLQPDQYLSVILDGADQSAFGLPHFMVKTKDDRGHSLKVRLIGLLEHNQKNKLRLFTLTEEYPTGANHVVEALHRFLNERINQSVLPRTFFIQVDNCTKENKNRYFFSYVESLIRWRLFDEIQVAFLPVGHTHEDIDQTFSRTSDRLRCNDAVTLCDLHSELRQVYNDQTTVGAMNSVANWSGLCEDEKCLTNLKSFSKYRYFKFHREESSTEICCMIRVNVTDDWFNIKELSGNGKIKSFTKFAPDLAKTPPLEIKCPDGIEKITECIEAAEARIPSVEKVEALLKLRDKVFKARSEEFHWDLGNSAEWSHTGLLRDDDNDLEDDEDIIQPAPSSIVNNITPETEAISDYRYDLNTFVAVKTEDKECDTPFWIAKVNQVHRNNENVITTLTVHWFDRSGSKDVFNCKYFPSYNNLRKKSVKTTPMKDEISVNSVLINFTSLTKLHRLPASVAQHLRGL